MSADDMPRYYRLINRIAVPCTLLEWGAMFETIGARRVANDVIERPDSDPVRVSTVFLGLDHNWSRRGPPILFESMIFGGPLDEHQVRYATWNEAARGHAALVDEARTEGELTSANVVAVIERIKASTQT